MQIFHSQPLFRLVIAATIVLWLGIGSLLAQVQANIVLAPPYPIHADDYLKMGDFAALTLINQSNSPQSVKLIPSIKSDDGKWAHIKPSFKPTKAIDLAAFQSRTLSAYELKALHSNLSADYIEQQGFDKNQIARSEALPEGVYQVCIEVRDYNTNAVLSVTEGCTSVNLTYFDPPVLTQPFDGQSVQSPGQQLIMFNWIPTGMAGKTQYQLQIVDMTKNNLFNPNDAFLNPAIQILYDKKSLITNSLVYGLSEPPLVAGHTYAVRIRAYDPQNKTLYKNEGVGPVSSFIYDGVMGSSGNGGGVTVNNKSTLSEISFVMGNSEVVGTRPITAGLAIPNFVAMQLRSKRSELPTNVSMRVIGENGGTCTEIRIKKKGGSAGYRAVVQGGGYCAVEDSSHFDILTEGLFKTGSVDLVVSYLDKNGKKLNEESLTLNMDYGGDVYFVSVKSEGKIVSGYVVALPKVTEKEIKETMKEICEDDLQEFKRHEGGFPLEKQITYLTYADDSFGALYFPDKTIIIPSAKPNQAKANNPGAKKRIRQNAVR